MAWRRGRAAILTTGVLAGAAMTSCKDDPSATITLTTGEEGDAFSRTPAPTTLVVENVGLDGKATEISRTSLPGGEVSLGDLGRTDVGAFRVSALDAAGKKLLKGESLFLQFGALETASLEVFVQRTGELARLPRSPIQLDAPHVGVTVARYVVAASGTSTFLYDLLTLKPTTPLPTLPRPAKSLAVFGVAALVIDDSGATTLDLSNGTATELTAPPGGTFGEISGGESTKAEAGGVYVIGGTRRSGGASPRVFNISAQGNVAFSALTSAREGACAAWVEGRGLFVYGGGAATEPGAELLVPGAAISAKLPLSPDVTKGCGAVALDGAHVLVVRGQGATDPGRAFVVDLGCASACTPAPWPGTLPLVRADVLRLGADAALAVGDDASGASHAFRLSASALPREIALRVPRRGARLVALPVSGTGAIVGGAPSIEQYVE